MENLLKSATATQADVDSATKKASALSKALQGAMVVGDDGLANQSISNHNLSADESDWATTTITTSSSQTLTITRKDPNNLKVVEITGWDTSTLNIHPSTTKDGCFTSVTVVLDTATNAIEVQLYNSFTNNGGGNNGIIIVGQTGISDLTVRGETEQKAYDAGGPLYDDFKDWSNGTTHRGTGNWHSNPTVIEGTIGETGGFTLAVAVSSNSTYASGSRIPDASIIRKTGDSAISLTQEDIEKIIQSEPSSESASVSISESASESTSLSVLSESLSESVSESVSESISESLSESALQTESTSSSESTRQSTSVSHSTSQDSLDIAKASTLPLTGDNTSVASLLGGGALLGSLLLGKKKKKPTEDKNS